MGQQQRDALFTSTHTKRFWVLFCVSKNFPKDDTPRGLFFIFLHLSLLTFIKPSKRDEFCGSLTFRHRRKCKWISALTRNWVTATSFGARAWFPILLREQRSPRARSFDEIETNRPVDHVALAWFASEWQQKSVLWHRLSSSGGERKVSD